MGHIVERMRDAMNAHDAEQLSELFAEGYESRQPIHPGRAFGGRAQVLANWTAVFAGVPDFTAKLVTFVEDEHTLWAEWDWSGRHTDNTPYAMRGVVIAAVRDGLITEQRLYLEPVDDSDADINEAVQQLYKPPASERPDDALDGQ